jgi:hypothetical protein
MKNHRETSVLAAVALIVAVAAIFGANVVSAEKTKGGRQRSFVFTYEVHVPANPDSKGETRLWMPLPQSDEHQSIRKLSIESPVVTRSARNTNTATATLFLLRRQRRHLRDTRPCCDSK